MEGGETKKAKRAGLGGMFLGYGVILSLASHLYGDSYKVGAKTYAKCTYCGHVADLTKDATLYN